MGNRLHNESYTMNDIATELGVSKSTVSRALAGSSRISQSTREKIVSFANEHGFKPNLVAKALAGQKTLNIAAIMPSEATRVQMMFFHECLLGMVKRAAESYYSVLVCISEKQNTDALESILSNKKVDGVVLTQLRKNDKNVELLKKSKLPFVVIGSSSENGITQVDSKMQESCMKFTLNCSSKLSKNGNVLFVCGSLDVEANNNRLQGFLKAMEEINIAKENYTICTELSDIKSCVCIGNWDLILCSDDILCMEVLEALKMAEIRVGKDVLLASFHDSVLLETSVPSVSALKIDAFNLGIKSSEIILKKISGEDVENEYIDCSFEMRESTNREL